MNEDTGDRQDKNFMANTQEVLDGMLDRYYELHGWDLKSSWPTEKVLKELELDFVIEDFKKKGLF